MVDYFVFIVSFVIGISLLVLCLCSVKCVGLCTRIEPYVYHPSSPVANAKIEMSEEELEERRQYILKRIGHKKVLIPNHDHSTTTSSSSTTGSSGGTTCDDGEDHHDHDLVDEEEGTSFHENNLEEIDLELGMPSTTSTCTATRTGDLASSSSSPSSSPSSSAQPYQCGAHPTTDSMTTVTTTTTTTTPSKPTTTNVNANAIATAPTSASVCPICMEEYEVGDNIAWSYNKQCPHVYHVDCIVQWLMKDQNGSSKSGDDCPMCRSSYLVDDPPSNIITKRLSYLVARS